MKAYIGIIMALLVSALVGCSSSRQSVDATTTATPTTKSVNAIGGNPAKYLPKAVIYKTNGDYNNHVFINLAPGSDQILSYPAITDVSSASAPVELGDGWLLDKRGGIGINSAFLTYTYAEYAALRQQPNSAQLQNAIIPDAKVTEVKALPITINEALKDINAVKQYIPKAN